MPKVYYSVGYDCLLTNHLSASCCGFELSQFDDLILSVNEFSY